MANEDDISTELGESLREHRSGVASGTVTVDKQEAYVGDVLTLDGEGLPANESLTVLWHTTEGGWGVQEARQVTGPTYRPQTEQLTTVSTDADGDIDAQVTVPEDYGGEHTVELQTDDEETVAEATVSIIPWFELEDETVPLGETFEVIGYGLGPNPVTNNYQVTWDNGMVGFMTGVANDGTGRATVRAVAPPGEHVVQVWRNFHGIPYLQNNTQSPYGEVADGRQSAWTIEVTEPEDDPETAWIDPLPDEEPATEHYPSVDEDTDADLTVTPSSGQPGTAATIEGENFPAGTEVDLVWHTHVGHERRDESIELEPRPEALPTVTADDDGGFQTEVTIPNAVGATRPITAEVDGQSIAVTGFVVQPTILDVSPTEGPVGTKIEIELSGVGWTTYGTAPYFVYDNRPMGYVDGIEAEDGVTRLTLRASGEPGYHYVDAYPSILDTIEDDVNFETKAHLSYRNNHPGRPVPALHFAFEVTE
jgi:hypothetical protein